MTDCCSKIVADMQRVAADLSASVRRLTAHHQPLVDTLKRQEGISVQTPGGAGSVPTLAELLQRVSTPLDAGFGQWDWFNDAQQGKTALTLPQAPNATKTSVSINSVLLLSPRDYTLTGKQLTFKFGLDINDWVRVKTYGG